MTARPEEADAIESPCIRKCGIDPETGRCAGCARTLDEIMRWREMTAAERRAIMAALPTRASAPG